MKKQRIPTHGPAGRVYALAQQMLQIPKDTPPQEAWRRLFDLPKDCSTATVGFAMSRAVGTAIKAQAMFHGEELECEFPDPYPPLIQLFARMRSDEPWGNIRNQVSPQVKANLALAAKCLAEGTPPEEEELEKDALDEIRQRASDLQQEVADAEIDAWLSAILGEHLERILIAIELYAVEGAEELRGAFLRSWADLLLQGTQVSEAVRADDSGKADTIVKKMLAFLKDFSAVVRAVRDTKVLLAVRTYLLEHLPG